MDVGSGTSTYTNQQRFLADYNQDNQVTSSAASLILSNLS